MRVKVYTQDGKDRLFEREIVAKNVLLYYEYVTEKSETLQFKQELSALYGIANTNK